MNKFLRFLIFPILFLVFCLPKSRLTRLFATNSLAQSPTEGENIIEARVIEIVKEGERETLGTKHIYQELKLDVYKGDLKDEQITIINGDLPLANLQKYKINDRLIINYGTDFEGNRFFQIVDYVRRDSLLLLFIIFMLVALLITRWYGFTSILGMFFSFLVIFKLILPQIIAGANPVLISILASIIIIPITFYLSHGFNIKTNVAIISTIVSLLITGILAYIFIEIGKLTGFSSEEAAILKTNFENTINMKGLILSGIILASLGALDDITVAQSSIVAELVNAHDKPKFIDIYKHAMSVGRDHISSMVNTLILVYTGASLPLLLLFVNNPHPFAEIINYEFIAEEIIRTLIASIGLILSVPLSTTLACFFFLKKSRTYPVQQQ